MSGTKINTKTFINLNIIALTAMHLSNQFIISTATNKNILGKEGGKYFHWKYGEIYYTTRGQGDPLLLIHDLNPELSSYEWDDIIDTLSRKNTVYAIDLPGCGRSTKPLITYTNYFYVLFLRSFIENIIRKKCTVIANGYSSSFAIMTLYTYPNLIKSIIAVNPKSINELLQTTDKKSKIACELFFLPIIGTKIYNIIESRQSIRNRITKNGLYNPLRFEQRLLDSFYEGAHINEDTGKYLLSSIKGKYMTVNIKKALIETGDKITILYGDKSENGKQITRRYQIINPRIKIGAIPRSKYMPHNERPMNFIAAVEKALFNNN